MSSVILEVKLEIPRHLEKMLEQFPDQVKKKVIRSSVRGAVAPVRAAMKTITRDIAQKSKRQQGTGATSRSIIAKIGSPKNEPGIVYGLIGPDRRHMEIMSPRKAINQPRNKYHLFQTKVSFQRDARKRRTLQSRLKSLGKQQKEVKSLYKNNFSRNASRNTPGIIKRRPVKYFHLLDRGFRHWMNGSYVRGNAIIDKAWARAGVHAKSRFERNMMNRMAQLLRDAGAKAK
jgi:hypothetical protein